MERPRPEPPRAEPEPLDPEEPEEPRAGYRVLAASVVGIAVAAVGVLLLVAHLGPGGSTATAVAFHPPAPIPTNGEYVRSRVLPSGDVRVDHWIRSRAPLSQLVLILPTVPALDPDRVVARDVAVQAGGRAVTVRSSLRPGAERLSFADTREVHVSYVLTGASRRTGQAGQTLVKLTSLRIDYSPARGTRVVAVTGAHVIALACSSSTTAAAPCGRQRSGTWTVRLRGAQRSDRVAALVDRD